MLRPGRPLTLLAAHCFVSLQLCFFAHNASQLRVTAKSLAAQQAQASSGNGKGKSKQLKQAGSSHSSSADDLLAGPSSPSAGGQADSSAAAEELMRQLELLRVEDPTAAATIMGLLGQLDIHPISRAGRQGSHASSDSLSGAAGGTSDQGGAGSEASQGSSPRTPVAQAPQLPAAAQRRDTAMGAAAGLKLGSPAISGGAALGARALSCELPEGAGMGSGRLSVQEHIAAVMSGKQAPEPQHPRRASYGLYSPAGSHAVLQVAGSLPAQGSGALAAMQARMAAMQAMGATAAPPQEVFGLASPAVGSTSGSEHMPGDLLASAMWGGDGQLCSPQFTPMMSPSMGNSSMCAASAGLPAQLQLLGLSQDMSGLSGGSVFGYGTDTPSTAGFSGALGGMVRPLGSGGFVPLMSPDSGSHGLPPAPLLPLQQQSSAGPTTVGSLGSPLVGTPQLLPSISPSAHAAAAMAQARLQQQQLLLLQQQQAAASVPAFNSWGGSARGVGSMLGAATAAGYAGNNAVLMPGLTGLSA